MIIVFFVAASFIAYQYGCVVGYDQQEKDSQGRKAFWEKVKRHGV